MRIHEGTAMLYPLSAIGCHVSKSPNDITGRPMPFASRAVSAMFGTFGYELDITDLAESEREEIRSQIEQYKKIRPLILQGDYYCLASCLDNEYCSAYEVVSKDAQCGFVVFRQILARPEARSMRVLLKGLDAERDYEIGGSVYSGKALMKAGYLFPYRKQDFCLSLEEFRMI
jgi:alpha-galactosidase